MKIETEQKATVLNWLLELIMDSLAKQLDDEDDELTGDDLLDFFALGIAAIIDNDTLLTTPRDRRLAVETARKHIERNVKELRTAHDESGVSLLSLILGNRTPTAH